MGSFHDELVNVLLQNGIKDDEDVYDLATFIIQKFNIGGTQGLFSRIKNIVNGSMDNEIAMYGDFKIIEKDGYDYLQFKLSDMAPLESLKRLMEELDADDTDVWVTGTVEISL
jgi:DNA repair protein RadC